VSNAPATRYSDRDVRENTEFFDIAQRYLQSYRGSFEYLLDCQRHFTVHGSLTVAMTRGVLNCMRNDPRVAGDLPAPQFWPDEPEATVTPIKGKKKKNRSSWKKRENPEPCEKTESHDGHYWGGETDYDDWCEGVPWLINREGYVVLPATVKRPFVIAKYAMKMIHKVADEGSHFVWNPEPHGWGWRWNDSPVLQVKLVCRYPSILREPRLITQPQAGELLLSGLELCRHCFSGDDLAT
jgi:hypothetical protein